MKDSADYVAVQHLRAHLDKLESPTRKAAVLQRARDMLEHYEQLGSVPSLNLGPAVGVAPVGVAPAVAAPAVAAPAAVAVAVATKPKVKRAPLQSKENDTPSKRLRSI